MWGIAEFSKYFYFVVFLATPVQSLPGLIWPQPSGLGLCPRKDQTLKSIKILHPPPFFILKKHFWHILVNCFLLLCDIRTLREFYIMFRTKIMWKIVFFYMFFGQRPSQHISSHVLVLHLLCKKKFPADNRCLTNFFDFFFS